MKNNTANASELKQDLSRLSQTHNLRKLRESVGMMEMVTVYFTEMVPEHTYFIDSALIPSNQIEACLSKVTRDLDPAGGRPGAIRFYENGTQRVEYFRFGNDDGIEPLVITRHFHGIHPDYREISEEFRFFHDLFHDRSINKYFKIGEDGNEQLVAIVSEKSIQIRLQEIRQFLAIKEMHLAIQFDYREHSTSTLEQLGIKAISEEDKRDENSCWGFNYGDIGFDNHRAFSRLLGKRLIKPIAKEKSGFWGFSKEQDKPCVDFIVGVDNNGDDITNTSDPDLLANNFGANRGAPHYLTQVDFKKTVLDKYYQQPSKYKVEDGYLRCGSLWGTYIDNHHKDKVSVWLGDLGRDLPYQEQLHWKAHNIAPQGKMSETFLGRQILAQFTDSKQPDHLFSQKYQRCGETSSKKLGWLMLLPLKAEDKYHVQSIRIASTDEQKDFDELILSLTKILIDSLNERELKALISKDLLKDLKPGSINLLEQVFREYGILDGAKHIAFLKNLQGFRSTGSAHRKGSKYQKLLNDSGVAGNSLSATFEGLLRQGLEFLEFLTEAIDEGRISTNRVLP